MVKELHELVQNGDPDQYYHWNKKLAEKYLKLAKNGDKNNRYKNWLSYLRESLYAGETEACIKEITNFLDALKLPYENIINSVNKPLFEILALAYLRKGEQDNCLNNHTPQSCILPLQSEGFHLDETGSRKAIEMYEILLRKYPNPTYQWLLNVAYMTLGEYPEKVPRQYLLDIPSSYEQDSFPAFNEIAMSVGLSVDGLSGGVCIDDFNGDELLDVFMTSYGMEDNVRLFLYQAGTGYFETTQTAGLKGITSGLNCIHADYDNDGWMDILILRGGWLNQGGSHPNSLLRNTGNGVFQDVTRSAGILSYHPTQTACWADFDQDGHLDVFIGNESTEDDPHPCELYHNNGDGTFSEVAEQYGLGNINTYVKGVVWGDIDNDGWKDLYISVLGGNNLLFHNQKGKFKEIGKKAGVSTPFMSFPCWFWDVNNDGYEDIFVSAYDIRFQNNLAGEYAKEIQNMGVPSEKPKLYINNGDLTFREAASEYGLDKTMYAMGSNFGDLDNDGFLDFYVGTGAPDPSTIVPNRMFRNVGGERFEEVTSAGNFGHIQKGHGVAFADLDADGDQDIYVVMGGAYEGDNFTNILYENPGFDNNWISVKLLGKQSNSYGLGANLVLTLNDGREVFRTVGTGGSFGSSPYSSTTIGIGQADTVSQLVVIWPSGKRQNFQDLKQGYEYVIEERINETFQQRPFSAPFTLTGQATHHHHQ